MARIKQTLFNSLVLAAVSLFAAAACLAVAAGTASAASGDIDLSASSAYPRLSTQEVFGISASSLDSQGRLLVLGTPFYSGGGNLAVLRFLADGTLDPSFGVGGRALFQTGGGTTTMFRIKEDPVSKRIIAAATICPKLCESRVFRFTESGALDNSFGRKGIAAISFSRKSHSQLSGIAIDSQGRVIVAGVSSPVWGLVVDNQGVALARLTPNGALDASFGSGGKIVTPLEGNPQINDMKLDSQGRIVMIASHLSPDVYHVNSEVIRFTAQGALDTSFGSGGVSVFGAIDQAPSDLAIDQTGRIVVGSSATGYSSSASAEIALTRLNSDGSLDSSFGSGGILAVRNPNAVSYGSIIRVAIDSQGRILAHAAKSTLFRFLSSGAADSAFGTDGSVQTQQVTLQLDSQDRIIELGSPDSGANLLYTRRLP